MEIQKTSNSQRNLEKEEWNWRNHSLTKSPTSKPQSSREYGTGTKTNIDQWNKIERPKINTHTYGHFIFDKGGKIYNGEKTIFLTSGLGKTGQPLVKD